jgi:hypothetical protein
LVGAREKAHRAARLSPLASRAQAAVPLFLRCVWARAESKHSLLEFVLALDDHVGCVEPRWRRALSHDARAADEWCASAFVPRETDEAAIARAALRVLRVQSDEAATTRVGASPSPGSSGEASSGEMSFGGALEVRSPPASRVRGGCA